MYGQRCNLFVFLAIVALQTAAGEGQDRRKDKVDAALVSLPINSKFWNPQLDDKTNMELIGIQYLDDSNKTVIEITDKSARLSAENVKNDDRNWTSNFFGRPRRGERYFVWGLLNLLKPMSWASGAPDAGLRGHSKAATKDAN